jgi:hypothetical protein
MNTGNFNLLAAITLTAALAAAPAALATDQPAATTAITVYISMHFGKKDAARDMNAMHAKMEKDGWRFADMEGNSENGDTEGFWVTYTKP